MADAKSRPLMKGIEGENGNSFQPWGDGVVGVNKVMLSVNMVEMVGLVSIR